MTKTADKPNTVSTLLDSDEQLLVRYREEGCTAAFETLVRRYERPLLAYLRRYVRSDSLADDVYQATLLRIHQKCRSFARGRRVRPWLFSIATHLAVDALRKQRRHPEVSLDADYSIDGTHPASLISLIRAETPTPLEAAEAHEMAERIHRAIDALPDHLRVVVLLFFFQDFKYREAAQILHVPVGTIKSRAHSALHRLRAAWHGKRVAEK
jgi:RNA polymerase sigma-70 factor (ECF subfamily)